VQVFTLCPTELGNICENMITLLKEVIELPCAPHQNQRYIRLDYSWLISLGFCVCTPAQIKFSKPNLIVKALKVCKRRRALAQSSLYETAYHYSSFLLTIHTQVASEMKNKMSREAGPKVNLIFQ